MGRLNLETVRLLGLNGTIEAILVNGESHTDFTILPSNEVVVQNLKVRVNSGYNITFVSTTASGDGNGASTLIGYDSAVLFCLLLNFVPRINV